MNITHTPVAALDPKPNPIAMVYLVGSQIEVYDDIGQPAHLAPHTATAARVKAPYHRQLGSAAAVCSTDEPMGGQIACPATAEGSGAILLASDRASYDGRMARSLQIGYDRDGAEAPVEQETTPSHTQPTGKGQ